MFSLGTASGLTTGVLTNIDWTTFNNIATNSITIGTANKLFLSDKTLLLGTTSGSTSGALTNTNCNTFNNTITNLITISTANSLSLSGKTFSWNTL